MPRPESRPGRESGMNAACELLSDQPKAPRSRRLFQYAHLRILRQVVQVRLSDRDRRGVLELVGELSSEPNGHPFAEPSLELLTRLVPQGQVGYYEWRLTWPYTREVVVESPAVSLTADVAAAAMHYCTTYPLSNVLLRSEKQPAKDLGLPHAPGTPQARVLRLRPPTVRHRASDAPVASGAAAAGAASSTSTVSDARVTSASVTAACWSCSARS